MQRQYTGTAGRIENSQVAVYLTYAAPRGHALIDRALYLPKSWADDPDRCDEAGIPADKRGFATKPALAAALIDRAVDAKVPAAWVAGDEVYGADPRLRAAIRGHGLGYVLAVSANRRVPTDGRPDPRRSRSPPCCRRGPGRNTPPAPAATATRSTPGPGSRCCAEDDTDTGCHHLLIRRNDPPASWPTCAATARTRSRCAPWSRVAGQRWRIEESFQAAKGLTGLDQHQVRRWTSWHRWTTLAMLAHAFLAVATATERDTQPTPTGLITLTVNEFRRLFDALLLAANRTLGHPAAPGHLATTTPTPSPPIPLPTTRTPMITI